MGVPSLGPLCGCGHNRTHLCVALWQKREVGQVPCRCPHMSCAPAFFSGVNPQMVPITWEWEPDWGKGLWGGFLAVRERPPQTSQHSGRLFGDCTHSSPTRRQRFSEPTRSTPAGQGSSERSASPLLRTPAPQLWAPKSWLPTATSAWYSTGWVPKSSLLHPQSARWCVWESRKAFSAL